MVERFETGAFVRRNSRRSSQVVSFKLFLHERTCKSVSTLDTVVVVVVDRISSKRTVKNISNLA